MRRGALLLAVLALAGCGGRAAAPPPKPPPKLPAALARFWASEAQTVASSLAAGDGCTAKQAAMLLRTSVVQAIDARRVPARYQETLLATVNALPQRIGCAPPPADQAPPPGHGHGHGHDKHGGGD